jgi:NAD(P)-dependent dehydrogenase (short-subunit alcohol dehydrogenase family)
MPPAPDADGSADPDPDTDADAGTDRHRPVAPSPPPAGDRLDGRTAVVTGGAGAVGTRTAVRLAREGAAVVVAQRSVDRAERVVDRIRDLGGEAAFVRTDLADPDAVDALVAATVERFGGLDVLVNNAANPHKAPADEMTRVGWQGVLDVNLTAPFLLARRAHEHMVEGGYGRILNVGAIQAHSPLPGAAAYAASKAGLEGLTRSLAAEWSPAPGVDLTVNTVLVGPVHGEDADIDHPDLPPEAVNERVPAAKDDRAATLVGRWGRPSDVAALVAFLASPEAGFLTAATVPCDGGRLVARGGTVVDQLGEQ